MHSNCRSPKNTQSYAQQLRLVYRQPGHDPRTSNLDYKDIMLEKRDSGNFRARDVGYRPLGDRSWPSG